MRENGARLAEATQADVQVVELFAFLHDACRRNEHRDPAHGARSAALARRLNGELFDLGPTALDLLATACHGHSDGGVEGDVTVLACWDADRLDLGRVGYYPDPLKLGTVAARDPVIIEWAYLRSIRRF